MRIFLIFIFLFSSTKAIAVSNVIYGGFSFGSILPENTISKFIHDRSNGQSLIDKVLLETSKKINNKSFKISYDLLKDGLSSKTFRNQFLINFIFVYHQIKKQLVF